jgi:muramoyltetrapeptide carboxypeptidase
MTSASVYVWCPAYPLADATAQVTALAASHHFAAAIDAAVRPSPLLTRHPGTGAWLPAAERQADLRHGCDATWLLAARGGYGCVDLLNTLPDRLPPVIGYSDLTVLHAAQLRRGGPGGLYGFMPGVRHGERAMASACALARGDGWAVESLPDTQVLQAGQARGPLFAGCLRVLAGLIGTPWMPDLAGHLLALEDIDEKPYRIDRDLFQLHAAGALNGIIGLVFGRFPVTLAGAYAGPSAQDICAAWAERLQVPAVFGVPFGHDPDPLTLAIGRTSTLTCHSGGWRLAQASTPPSTQP